MCFTLDTSNAHVYLEAMKRRLFLYFAIVITIVSTISSANTGQACPMEEAHSSMAASCKDTAFMASHQGITSCSKAVVSVSQKTSDCDMPMHGTMCMHNCGGAFCSGSVFQYSMFTSHTIHSVALLNPVAGELLHPTPSTAFLCFHPEGPYHPPTA